MENWEKRKAWIAHFDILGFKEILNNDSDSIPINVLQSQIDDLIKYLNEAVDLFDSTIDYYVFSDTFIIYSKNEVINDFPGLVSVSKRFINKSISMGLPIRGAISYGDCIFGYCNKVLMGRAFLESHSYGENQNWLGLILTPSATKELLKHDLHPIRNGFVNRDVHLKSLIDEIDQVYAYIFIDGSTSFECPLLKKLEEMQYFAPDNVKIKYKNTINFIKKFYVVKRNI